MKPDLFTRKPEEPDTLDWLGGALIAAMVVFGGVLTAYSVIIGPEVRAQMEDRDMAERQQEDASFCSKFGMPPPSEAFAACARDLVHVRRLETTRLHRRIQPY